MGARMRASARGEGGVRATRMADLDDPVAKARDSDVVIRYIIRVERFRTARRRLSCPPYHTL